jgi:hypothetical protein
MQEHSRTDHPLSAADKVAQVWMGGQVVANEEPEPEPEHQPLFGTVAVRQRRGTLACVVESLKPELLQLIERNVPKHAISGQRKRDGDERYHITLVPPREWRRLSYRTVIPGDREAAADTAKHGGEIPASKSDSANSRASTQAPLADAIAQLSGTAAVDGIRCLGLGTARRSPSQCWYLVLGWPAAAAWRAGRGLPPHDFHITVGIDGEDVHGISKDATTLLEALEEPGPGSDYGQRAEADVEALVGPLLATLVTPARLEAYLRHLGTNGPVTGRGEAPPEEMKALLRGFRAAVMIDLRSRTAQDARHATKEAAAARLCLLQAVIVSQPFPSYTNPLPVRYTWYTYI